MSKNITMKKNELGNVSEIQIDTVFEEVSVDTESFHVTFYFEISHLCGLSNGEYPVYCKIDLDYLNKDTDVSDLRLGTLLQLGKDLGLTDTKMILQNITPISEEYYESVFAEEHESLC